MFTTKKWNEMKLVWRTKVIWLTKVNESNEKVKVCNFLESMTIKSVEISLALHIFLDVSKFCNFILSDFDSSVSLPLLYISFKRLTELSCFSFSSSSLFQFYIHVSWSEISEVKKRTRTEEKLKKKLITLKLKKWRKLRREGF